MSQLGMVVLLNRLVGNEETAAAWEKAKGKVIASLKLQDDWLMFAFTDGTAINVYDDGQSCCESRYMTTDDKLDDFVGADLLGMEIRDAPNVAHEWGEHEVQFLLVTTSKGVFTMETHNEHNGYYGGFSVVIREA